MNWLNDTPVTRRNHAGRFPGHGPAHVPPRAGRKPARHALGSGLVPAQLSSRPVGAHVPVTGGLASGGLRYAAEIGAETIQVFVSNPRGWALSAGDARQDAALADHVAGTGLRVFVHAPYLINLGSPDPVTRRRSAASLAHSLRRGREIGALGVVVHTGSAVSVSREQGMRHVRECLLPLLGSLGDDGPELLLEPTAGQGRMLCTGSGDLGSYLDAVDWHPRAGLCLDTCHEFAAGHDLAARGGAARLLDALTPAVRSRLRLIHANDSKDGCGSHRDRHENIGAGQIGTVPFAALLRHPATRGVPFIAETPGPRAAVAADVAILKGLRGKGRLPRSRAAAMR
jgi:deoxyribonuclease IV